MLFQDALQENIQTKYCKSTGQTFGDQSIRKAMIFERSSQKHRLLDHWRVAMMQRIQMKLQLLTKVEHNFNCRTKLLVVELEKTKLCTSCRTFFLILQCIPSDRQTLSMSFTSDIKKSHFFYKATRYEILQLQLFQCLGDSLSGCKV